MCTFFQSQSSHHSSHCPIYLYLIVKCVKGGSEHLNTVSVDIDSLFRLVFYWVHSFNKYVLSASYISCTHFYLSFGNGESRGAENGAELTVGFTISNWQPQEQDPGLSDSRAFVHSVTALLHKHLILRPLIYGWSLFPELSEGIWRRAQRPTFFWKEPLDV